MRDENSDYMYRMTVDMWDMTSAKNHKELSDESYSDIHQFSIDYSLYDKRPKYRACENSYHDVGNR